jgi:flagellar hook-associated protein 3 FlgL
LRDAIEQLRPLIREYGDVPEITRNPTQVSGNHARLVRVFLYVIQYLLEFLEPSPAGGLSVLVDHGSWSMRLTAAESTILLNALSVADNAQQKALLQMTTGKRVNVASDDPAAAAVQVQTASRQSDYDQYLRSISSVSGELQTADSALSSCVTTLQRAVSLGVQGANGTLSQQDRQALASEVKEISNQVLGIANQSYNGHFLFAGTADSQPPYVADPNAPGGIAYQGNDLTNQIQVEDGHSVAMNLPGSKLFSAPGANVFQALSDLANALENGSGIDTATESVRTAYDQLTTSRVFYGSTMSQLNSDQSFLQSAKLQLQQNENDNIGIDMNVAATNLVNAENARNSALAAAARTSNLSLLDYLPNR